MMCLILTHKNYVKQWVQYYHLPASFPDEKKQRHTEVKCLNSNLITDTVDICCFGWANFLPPFGNRTLIIL